MADDTAHITMLQRSPSYVMPLPKQDPIANGLRKVLPDTVAYRVTRSINKGRQRLIYGASQRYPKQVRRIIRALNVKALPEGYDVDTHFNPKYNPWDQRMCAVPDSDLFTAISQGKAEVVTDQIERFTKTGILLKSGRELPADIIVTATGLSCCRSAASRFRSTGRSRTRTTAWSTRASCSPTSRTWRSRSATPTRRGR